MEGEKTSRENNDSATRRVRLSWIAGRDGSFRASSTITLRSSMRRSGESCTGFDDGSQMEASRTSGTRSDRGASVFAGSAARTFSVAAFVGVSVFWTAETFLASGVVFWIAETFPVGAPAFWTVETFLAGAFAFWVAETFPVGALVSWTTEIFPLGHFGGFIAGSNRSIASFPADQSLFLSGLTPSLDCGCSRPHNTFQPEIPINRLPHPSGSRAARRVACWPKSGHAEMIPRRQAPKRVTDLLPTRRRPNSWSEKVDLTVPDFGTGLRCGLGI
jgi:hypothetical protein